MGLVATMAALVLGLLVSSAKGSYDAERSEVIQMAAKVAFLDRVLAIYGPEAAEARTRFHEAVEEAVRRCGPEKRVHRRTWLPTRKQATQSMAPFRVSRRATKCRANSKNRLRPWPVNLVSFGCC